MCLCNEIELCVHNENHAYFHNQFQLCHVYEHSNEVQECVHNQTQIKVGKEIETDVFTRRNRLEKVRLSVVVMALLKVEKVRLAECCEG